MTFGLSTTGFTAKRVEDIVAEINDTIRGTFGDNVNLDSRTPIGQLRDIFAEREALLWELAEQIYRSQSPQSAEGVPLDEVASFTGSIRKQATKSTGILTLFGVAGTLVTAGKIFSVVGNVDAKFVSDVDATIAAGVDEVQRLTFLSVPNAGTFTLTFGTETTAAINWNDSAATITGKLEALANIGSGNVVVTGSIASKQLNITFGGTLGDQNVGQITVGANALTSLEGGTINTIADVAASLDRDVFLLYDDLGSVAFWADVDNNGASTPAAAIAANRHVEVTTVVTGDSATVVATKFAAFIEADAKFTASAIGNQITWANTLAGARTDAVDVDTGFTLATTNQGFGAGALTITPSTITPGMLPQIDVAITAQTAGVVAGPAGSITVIETPVAGLTTVSNAEDAELGEEIESDSDFKIRRLEELAIAGRATTNAILARVSSVEDVTAVVVFENDLHIPDVDGRPPHSVQVVAQGGTDAAVAAAIFDSVSAGITTHGAEVENVTDNQGFIHAIKFDRPTEVDVWLELDITKDTNFFPLDGADQVEAAMLAYGETKEIGEDVVIFGTDSLIAALNDIPGITDVVVRIGELASPTLDDNIIVAPNEIADFDSSRIIVTVF